MVDKPSEVVYYIRFLDNINLAFIKANQAVTPVYRRGKSGHPLAFYANVAVVDNVHQNNSDIILGIAPQKLY